jgi:murein L,D-transpeptidase YcbB/YkuD
MKYSQRRTALVLSLLLLALLAANGCKRKRRHQTVENAPDYSAQVQQIVPTGKLAALHWPNYSDYKQAVVTLYANNDNDVLWTDNGKPTQQALALIRNFQHASERGLIPDDYDAWRLPGLMAAALKSKDLDRIAKLDVMMTVDAMRFISDLHIGRVNPHHFSFGVNVDQKKYDLAQFVQEKLIDASDVDGALSEAEPQTPQYTAIRTALAHYVSLLPQDHTEPVPAVVGKSIEPGKPYPGSAQIAARLALFGDLDETPGTLSTTDYDPQLVEAVKHFQHRHGIDEDAKLGKDTIAALNVPLGVRINQLTDTLERWRWLSDEFQNATLMVNLPEFTLRAYSGDDHHEDFSMRVVVGQSVKEHRTPVITDHMKYLVFRPYWNVPVSIMKAEIAPHMRANSNYLATHNFETVDSKGNPVSANADKVAHGGVIVREKPGPKNSLGLVKFLFPNQFNVYLHSTPATELFNRTKRDFSHGCIRLQEPEKLAAWLLRDNNKWNDDSIHTAMESGPDNKTVLLSHPIPIVIFYATAYSAEDGDIHFFSDIYGYDKMLEDALRHGPPYPQTPVVEKVQADI